MTRHNFKRPAAKAKSPRPVFPFAVTLRAVALLLEGDGSPALYLCAEDRAGRPRLYRVPDDCRVTLQLPYPPEKDGRRVLSLAGSYAVFQRGEAVSVLAVHSIRACRELLEVLDAHAATLKAEEEAARHIFDQSTPADAFL